MPGGHESPSGAFKPQTGLRSKCRVFSAARSQRFRRAGADGLRHPASASCLGRHSHPAGRCPNSSSLYPPQAAVVAVALFSRFSDLKAPQPLRRQLPAGEQGAPSPSPSVTPCPLFCRCATSSPDRGKSFKGRGKKHSRHALGSLSKERQETCPPRSWLSLRESWREAPERVRSPAGSQRQQIPFAVTAPPVKK